MVSALSEITLKHKGVHSQKVANSYKPLIRMVYYSHTSFGGESHNSLKKLILLFQRAHS